MSRVESIKDALRYSCTPQFVYRICEYLAQLDEIEAMRLVYETFTGEAMPEPSEVV